MPATIAVSCSVSGSHLYFRLIATRIPARAVSVVRVTCGTFQAFINLPWD
jgi:hypothetical protein